MGRRRRSTLDDLAALPWPVGIALGIAGYVLIRYGIPAWLAGQDGPFAHALAAQLDTLATIAWMVLALCTFAAAVSFFNARRRRRLLEAQSGLDSIAAMGWRDFERLVGEAFRRRGYTVEETGLGGADGGIDLILRRNGKRTLVQCKQWRNQKVPVNVVREMYGLLAHHKADAVCISALGGFTADAARFTQGKPIELIDGPALLGMIQEVLADRAGGAQQPSPFRPAPKPVVSSNALTHSCPRCGVPMVERANRKTGDKFWGCAAFPKCRATR